MSYAVVFLNNQYYIVPVSTVNDYMSRGGRVVFTGSQEGANVALNSYIKPTIAANPSAAEGVPVQVVGDTATAINKKYPVNSYQPQNQNSAPATNNYPYYIAGAVLLLFIFYYVK